jgi:hypothetical protein
MVVRDSLDTLYNTFMIIKWVTNMNKSISFILFWKYIIKIRQFHLFDKKTWMKTITLKIKKSIRSLFFELVGWNQHAIPAINERP